MMLFISNHAFRRFSEFNPQFTIHVPRNSHVLVDLETVKKLRRSVMLMLKNSLNAMRTAMPPNHFFNKFMKYGAKTSAYFEGKDRQCLVIVRDGSVDSIVTVSQRPKTKPAWPVDKTVLNPYFAVYLKDVDSIGVPYRLQNGVTYSALVKILAHVNVPMKFGVISRKESDDDEET